MCFEICIKTLSSLLCGQMVYQIIIYYQIQFNFSKIKGVLDEKKHHYLLSL